MNRWSKQLPKAQIELKRQTYSNRERHNGKTGQLGLPKSPWHLLNPFRTTVHLTLHHLLPFPLEILSIQGEYTP